MAILTIHNRTRYSTPDLRRFFAAGLAAMGARPDKVVTVGYTHGRRNRTGTCGGWAYFGAPGNEHRSIAMFLPTPTGAPLNLTDLALTWRHEVLHTLGLRHADMCEDDRWCRGPAPAWAEGLAVAWRAAPPVAAAARPADTRLADARVALKRWEMRAKRAATYLKKYHRRIAALERVAAAGDVG